MKTIIYSRQDVEYENDNLFKKALVVKDDLLIVNYADKFKTYKLTEQFFVLLTDAGVSVDIINELREIQDKEYASKNALVSAVKIRGDREIPGVDFGKGQKRA
ncbi:MAG: hypothetical protein JRC86_08480 [Deltaproteobacteria bacterium]|nr:hypothetical protein [Deltaproteobacteria bacterium]